MGRRHHPRQSNHAPVHEQFSHRERSKTPAYRRADYAAGRSSVNFLSIAIISAVRRTVCRTPTCRCMHSCLVNDAASIMRLEVTEIPREGGRKRWQVFEDHGDQIPDILLLAMPFGDEVRRWGTLQDMGGPTQHGLSSSHNFGFWPVQGRVRNGSSCPLPVDHNV